MNKRKYRKKRILALVLSMAVCFSVLPVQGILAADVSTGQVEENGEDLFLDGAMEDYVEDSLENQSGVQADHQLVGQETGSGEEQDAESGESQEISVPVIQYVYIDKPYITTPEKQQILVSMDAPGELSDAVLVYSRLDGDEILETTVSEWQESAALFEMDFADESQSGIYQLQEVRVTAEGGESVIDLQEIGIDIQFGVNQICETQPDAVVEKTDGAEEAPQSTENIENSITFMTIDSEGNMTEGSSVEDVVNEAADAVVVSESAEQPRLATGGGTDTGSGTDTDSGNLVVVLDPGHGGGDPGTSGNGANEKDLTLKIAKYCKNELEEYSGVTVYLTRETDRWVGENVTSANADLAPRVEFAKSKNADLFVSIHLNSSGIGTAKGSEVYYPNSNYNAEVSNAGKKAAQDILDELTALGLTNRGVKIRNSENNTTYPDGSLADYYGLIRMCKEAGIPGIIVEHAFLDNADDYAKYLSSDEKLQKLGVADATGIANALGLERGEWLQDSKGWRFRYADGSYAKDGWKFISGYWYYFDASGYRQTGLITVSGSKYYLDEEGRMKTGWLQLDDTWYYFNGSGVMKTGWLQLGSTWYYLDSDGKMVTGWRTIDKVKYYFGVSGNMYTGTHVIEGVTCVFDASGAYQVTEGWKTENGKQYFLQNGKKTTGWLKLDDTWYYFDGSGAMVTGWLKLGSSWYYLDSNGKMLTGFQKVGNATYYLNPASSGYGPEGAMAVGWRLMDNTWYYFNGSGAMVTGWLKLGSTWYYLDSNGKMLTGFQKVGNATYYLNPASSGYGPEGAMAVGWRLVDNTWYYFNGSGAMVTGWLKLGNTWYYLNADGKMATGWLTVNGKTYYLGSSGNMYTGTQVIGGVTYNFDSSGACQNPPVQDNNGWVTENGKKYYLADGKKVTGWKKISGTWYYFSPDTGVMMTGWVLVGDYWYFTESSGAMHKGWLTDGSYQYYLNPSSCEYGPEGAMTTGYREIDGTWYYFEKKEKDEKTTVPEGSLNYTGVTSIMGASKLGNDKATVVNKMVKQFNSRGVTYPGDVFEKGGAPDITTFCELLYDEATLEGVKPEVVFGQAMMETGYLQYGGDVKVEQFNFAGLGATGNGNPGNSYESVQIGIRAQVQHLKAYASEEELKSECVDDRFKYVTRGSAPYVEWLGYKENPNGVGWASGKKYGMSLMKSYIQPMY